MADPPKAPGAGFDRSGTGPGVGFDRSGRGPDDKCNRLFEALRQAMQAEADANEKAVQAQQRFNAANDRLNDWITRRDAAQAKWDDLYKRMAHDMPNIQAARKDWQEYDGRTLNQLLASLTDEYRVEHERWRRAEDLAKAYAASEFETIHKDLTNAEKNIANLRPEQTRALSALDAAQTAWQRAADAFQRASDRYQKECGGGARP